MQFTYVKELMELHPVMISPDATLQDAAKMMKEKDCGFLPVGTERAPQGVITDRDIVIRALAAGKDPATEEVRDYMTHHVHACWEEDTLEDAAETMNEKEISRLVVVNGNDEITGVLTFGHIIRTHPDRRETARVVDEAVGRRSHN